MSTSRRRKAGYHHGNLRPALLRVASDIMEKQGLEALGVRDLARRAGVSHNAPYRHFADLKALRMALAAEGFEILKARMQGKAGNELGEAYVAFALEYPQRFRLMFGGGVRSSDSATLREAAAGAYEALLRAFRARADLQDPEVTAAAAWSLVHGLANLLLHGHFDRATGGRAETARFIRRVLGSVRFAGAAQRSA